MCNVHNLGTEIYPLARKEVLIYNILFGDISVNIAIFSSLHTENETNCQVLNSVRRTIY